MQDIFYRFAVCSISMSFVALLFILTSPILTKRYGAKWQYYAWLIIIVGFIVPFRPSFEFTLFPSGEILTEAIRPAMTTIIFDAPGGVMAEPGNALATISLVQVIGLIWLSGLIAVLGFHILRHRRFSRLVRRWNMDFADTKTLETVARTKSELNISMQVNLKRCELLSSPMMTGFFRPTILMPASRFSESELDFIIRHELVHFKRKDMWYKCLVLITTAIHWFNPVVYLMSRRISELCELSCDAEVVKSSGMQTRKEYTEAIIGTIQSQSKMKTIFSTNFYGGKNSMKKRISSILDTKKKRAGAIVMCVALILTIGTGAALAAGAFPSAASLGGVDIPNKGTPPTVTAPLESHSGDKDYFCVTTDDYLVYAYASSDGMTYYFACSFENGICIDGSLVQKYVFENAAKAREFASTSNIYVAVDNVVYIDRSSGNVAAPGYVSNLKSDIINEIKRGNYDYYLSKAASSGALPPVASLGVTPEASPAPPSSNEANASPRFEGWKDFVTYDYDENVYYYEGKSVQLVWDVKYPNPESWCGFSGSLMEMGDGREDQVGLIIVRNPETYIVEGVAVMTEKDFEQLDLWRADFNAYIGFPYEPGSGT